MKIAQVVPTIVTGDAVGNNCRAIDAILREAGYDTKIYAENIDPRLINSPNIEHISRLQRLQEQDILLYHLAIAFDCDLKQFGGRVIFQYHNVTPPEFFAEYDDFIHSACRDGLNEMRALRNMPDLCWADSEFNRQDLINAGYTCCIHTIPILVPFEDYLQPPDPEVLKRYDDDFTNFLFVGRVVPNKAHEDVIRTFAWYQKHINPRCRLFLVGNDSLKSYVDRLKRYIKVLDVQNVIFPGHISFNAILAYYRAADVFLCMSQHEGFCVPLLEAMQFHIPIVARNTTAIPYTLGGAGVLLEDNNPIVAALAVDRIVRDKALRNEIIAGQDRRLQFFSTENIKHMILDEIKALT